MYCSKATPIELAKLLRIGLVNLADFDDWLHAEKYTMRVSRLCIPTHCQMLEFIESTRKYKATEGLEAILRAEFDVIRIVSKLSRADHVSSGLTGGHKICTYLGWQPSFYHGNNITTSKSSAQYRIFCLDICYSFKHGFTPVLELCHRELAYRPDPNCSACRPQSRSCTESQNHAEDQSQKRKIWVHRGLCIQHCTIVYAAC